MAWGFFGSSVLGKSRERSRAKKYLHGNYTAGHVTPNEHYLDRAGLRGRKIWLCCYLFALVYLLTLVHLMVTCLILGVLRFNVSGFPYFAFSRSSTLFEGGPHLSDISIATPYGINAYSNMILSTQQDNKIQLETNGLGSHLSLTKSAINMTVKDSLRLTHAGSEKQLLFANVSLLQMEEISPLETITTSTLTTHTIREVNSMRSSSLVLKGAGGINIGGGVVNITGVGGVNLTGQQGLTLSGNSGITVPRLPVPSLSSTKYHLCARADGTLFLVPSNPQRCQTPP